jgi:hypothetical protein
LQSRSPFLSAIRLHTTAHHHSRLETEQRERESFICARLLSGVSLLRFNSTSVCPCASHMCHSSFSSHSLSLSRSFAHTLFGLMDQQQQCLDIDTRRAGKNSIFAAALCAHCHSIPHPCDVKTLKFNENRAAFTHANANCSGASRKRMEISHVSLLYDGASVMCALKMLLNGKLIAHE